MEAFLIQNMAPIMFGSLVVILLLGYPAAFSLAFVGLFYALVGIWLGLFQPDFLQALPDRIYGVMSNDTLLAIPFFTFMGLVLERSGMAEDLLDTIGQLFGTVRGGLAYAVVFVGALLAATTGVVAASVISMGLISLPIMLRYGYDHNVSHLVQARTLLAQSVDEFAKLTKLTDETYRNAAGMQTSQRQIPVRGGEWREIPQERDTRPTCAADCHVRRAYRGQGDSVQSRARSARPMHDG